MKNGLSKFEVVVMVASLASIALIIAVILEFAEVTSTLVYLSSSIWVVIPLLALILGIIGLKMGTVRKLISIPTVTVNSVWLAFVAFVNYAVGALP